MCDNNAELIDDVTFNGSIAFATYGSNAGVLVVPISLGPSILYRELESVSTVWLWLWLFNFYSALSN